jgi:hypothetical protein
MGTTNVRAVCHLLSVQVRGVQRAIRSLESDVLLLHSQVDEADRVIAGQREGDKQVTSLLPILTVTAHVNTFSIERCRPQRSISLGAGSPAS